MIGLKSGMKRPNHANKLHDFGKKGARGKAHDTKSCVFEKKVPAATLRTTNHVFYKKKRLRQRSQQTKHGSFIKRRLRQRSLHKKYILAPRSVQDVEFSIFLDLSCQKMTWFCYIWGLSYHSYATVCLIWPPFHLVPHAPNCNHVWWSFMMIIDDDHRRWS